MAKSATLVDNFDDNTTNATLWNVNCLYNYNAAVTVTETSQRLQIALSSSSSTARYNGYRSVASYDFTGSSVFAKLVQQGKADDGAEAVFEVQQDANNYIGWVCYNGNVYPRIRQSGSNLTDTGIAFTTGMWLKMSESGGTVTWWTAPATASNPPLAGEWTAGTTYAPSITMTACTVGLAGGTWRSVTTAGTVIWDSLNIAAAGTPATATPAGLKATFSLGTATAKGKAKSNASSASITSAFTNPAAKGKASAGALSETSIITNGGFDSATAWYTATGWAVANGVMSYDGTGAQWSMAYQPITLVAGQSYSAKLTAKSISGGFNYYIYKLSPGAEVLAVKSFSTVGSYSLPFVGAGNAPQRFCIETTTASGTVSVDDVAVYPQPTLIAGTPSATGRATAAPSGLSIYADIGGLENRLTYSDGALATVSQSALVTDAAIPIDGFTASIQYPATVASGSAYISKGIVSYTAGRTYSLSCFIEMDDGGVPVIGLNNASGDFTLIVANSWAIINPTVTLVRNNIYRVSAARTFTTGANNVNGIYKYAAQSGRGFRITGWQINTAPYASEYTQTTDTTKVGIIKATGGEVVPEQPAFIAGGGGAASDYKGIRKFASDLNRLGRRRKRQAAALGKSLGNVGNVGKTVDAGLIDEPVDPLENPFPDVLAYMRNYEFPPLQFDANTALHQYAEALAQHQRAQSDERDIELLLMTL